MIGSASRRLRDERGMTLVELVVAMMILSIVMLVMTTTLSSIQRAVVEEDVRTRLNDQARLAVQSIDRLVRSGNILYDPVNESGNDPYGAATGYMFRIYTQAEQTAGQSARCGRSWSPRTHPIGRSWRTPS
jgi:prepilin-type N-terminal cleavage/methylation domain-containing protein